MNSLDALEAQYRTQEVARAANHPSRLMAHDLKRAGTDPARGHPARAVLRALAGLRHLGAARPQQDLNGLRRG
jgi:hypothetical protein